RPARLVILGDGPDRENVEALAGSLGLSPAVHFAGFQANPWKYFARSRVLLHASRAEGLPGALIQAMACGTPVVSTDCDFGPREVIEQSGHDGVLVPVGDAGALAAAADALLVEPERRDRMAAMAACSAARFSIASAVDRYQDAIEG